MASDAQTDPDTRACTSLRDISYHALQPKGNTSLTEKIFRKCWSSPTYIGEARMSTLAAYGLYDDGGRKVSMLANGGHTTADEKIEGGHQLS
jgi:hypothetical protein